MEWVPLAAVGGLVVLLVVARWPIAASIGLYAILLPFDSVLSPAQTGGIHLHLTWLVGVAVVGIILATALIGKRIVCPPQVAAWLILLVLWAAMTSFWAINTDHSIFRLPVMALLLALYLAAVSVRVTDEELRSITWLAILGGCLAAAICLYGFTHGRWWVSPNVSDIYEQLPGRASISMGNRITNPNTLGATLILPLSLGIGQLLHAKGPMRILLIGFLAVISAGICATMSRQAVVASAIVCIVYFWRSRVARPVSATIGILAITIAAVMPQLFFERMGQSLSSRGEGRFDIWIVGFHALRHYALLGAGLDCFSDAYNQFLYKGANFVGFSRAPHNIYVGTAVELGIVGFVLLAGVIVGHLRLSAGRAASGDWLRLQLLPYHAALIGLLVSGLFLDLLWEQYFWFTLILLVMAVGVYKRKVSRVRADSHLYSGAPGVFASPLR